MKIRYLVAFGLLMLAVVVGLYLLTGFTPTWEPAVSEENFLLVHKGMTLQEVEEVLGHGLSLWNGVTTRRVEERSEHYPYLVPRRVF